MNTPPETTPRGTFLLADIITLFQNPSGNRQNGIAPTGAVRHLL
jgi:hypothetical protein